MDPVVIQSNHITKPLAAQRLLRILPPAHSEIETAKI